MSKEEITSLSKKGDDGVDKPSSAKSELPSARPNQLHIGYYFSKIKKKDMEQYLVGLCRNRFDSLDSCYISMKPYRSGYLYEIHEGGEGKGCLGSVIKILEKGEVAHITTTAGTTAVEDVGVDGVISYILGLQDEQEDSKGVAFNGKMTRVRKKGAGFFVFGLVFVLVGLASLSSSAYFKYIVVDKEKSLLKSTFKKVLPTTQLKELKKYEWSQSKYVTQMSYKGGKWDMKIEEIKTSLPLPPDANGEGEEINKDLTQQFDDLSLSEDRELVNLKDMAKGK